MSRLSLGYKKDWSHIIRSLPWSQWEVGLLLMLTSDMRLSPLLALVCPLVLSLHFFVSKSVHLTVNTPPPPPRGLYWQQGRYIAEDTFVPRRRNYALSNYLGFYWNLVRIWDFSLYCYIYCPLFRANSSLAWKVQAGPSKVDSRSWTLCCLQCVIPQSFLTVFTFIFHSLNHAINV